MDVLDFFDKHTWLPTIIAIPITIFVTVFVAVWQINRQLRNTLKSQRANKLDELHMQIYKEIAEKIEACEMALTNVTVMVRMIPYSFENKIDEDNRARAQGRLESTFAISERCPDFNTRSREAMDKFAEVLSVMEKYEIAFNDFTTIRQHIFQTQKKLNEVMSDFHHVLMQFLPMDVKEEDKAIFNGAKVINQPLPDTKALEHIRALSNLSGEMSLDLTSYLHDLRIEAQNVLLSPIFNDKKAPVRVPEDLRYTVLTLDTPKKGTS